MGQALDSIEEHADSGAAESSGWHGDPAPVYFVLLALIAILIPLAGGGLVTAQGLFVAVSGALIALRPPRFLPTRSVELLPVFGIIFLVLAVLPWPEAWRPEWWLRLQALGVPLPATKSPTPVYSFEAAILMMAGALGILAVVANPVRHDLRKRLLLYFCLGVGVIAGISGILGWAGVKYPLAPDVHNFSFLPNRNHSGGLFAAGGVVAFGLLIESLFRKRWRLSAVCLIALAGAFVGLVSGLSRSAIICFFAAYIFWLAITFSVRRLTPIVAGAVPVFTALFVFAMGLGGRTIERVVSLDAETGLGFRANIYRDALQMAMESPLTGHGLGMFEAVFPHFRDESASDLRILHPESDYLWVLSETGIFGLMLLLTAGFVFFRCTYRLLFKKAPYRSLALAGAFVFLLQGIIDVPLHKPATGLACIVLFGLCLDSGVRAFPTMISPILFRSLGTIVALVGLLWVASGLLGLGLHSGENAREKTKIREAIAAASQTGTDAVSQLSAYPRRYPLDWEGHFIEGAFALREGRSQAATLAFRRAAAVEPVLPDVPYVVGRTWAPVNPRRAFIAWADMIERTNNPDLLRRIELAIAASGMDAADRRKGAAFLSKRSPERRARYMLSLDDDVFAFIIEDEVAHGGWLPAISRELRESVIGRWARVAPQAYLAWERENPDASKLSYRARARALAALEQFSAACALVEAYVPDEILPPSTSSERVGVLRREYQKNPSDEVAAINYLRALILEGDSRGATQVVDRLVAQREMPAYLYFWQAKTHAAIDEYDKAWKAWENYFQLKPDVL